MLAFWALLFWAAQQRNVHCRFVDTVLKEVFFGGKASLINVCKTFIYICFRVLYFFHAEWLFDATSAWISMLLVCCLSQTAITCRASMSCDFWAACDSVANRSCQCAVSCFFVRQQPVQNSARETRGRRQAQAELIWPASRIARVWSGSSEVERPEPGCSCCRRRRNVGWKHRAEACPCKGMWD